MRAGDGVVIWSKAAGSMSSGTWMCRIQTLAGLIKIKYESFFVYSVCFVSVCGIFTNRNAFVF